MSILSDEIFEQTEVYCQFFVRHIGRIQEYLEESYRDIKTAENAISAALSRIPINEIDESTITECCKGAVAWFYKDKFKTIERDRAVWTFTYKPSRYSRPIGFIISTQKI